MRPTILVLALIFPLGCNAISGIDEFAVGQESDRDAEATEGFPADAHIEADRGSEAPTETATTPPSDTGTDAPKPPDGTPPCAIEHSNGLGGHYWSCEPRGNWPSLTWDVWASYPGDAKKASTPCPSSATVSNCVIRYGAPLSGGGYEWIAMWCWSGEPAGHVRLTKPAGIDGECPTTSDPTWD